MILITHDHTKRLAF